MVEGPAVDVFNQMERRQAGARMGGARVAAVAVQAARVQSALGMERPEDVAAEIVRTLEELGKG